jgi:hypothetical protein
MADQPTPKSTVRKRQRNEKAATQRYLPIAEIHNDTVLLKNGGIRGVLAVEALNFNLKSETEQQGIIAGYASFVNTIVFPLQIVIRSNRTNIDDYLQQVTDAAKKHKTELLRQQTLGYVEFMKKLLDVADIMQKRFYVIVPVDRTARKKSALENMFSWMSPDDTLGGASQRRREFTQGLKQLNERVEVVETGLANVGLHTKRLTTRDLVELFYQIYNPQTAQHQKIPGDLEQLKMESNTL